MDLMELYKSLSKEKQEEFAKLLKEKAEKAEAAHRRKGELELTFEIECSVRCSLCGSVHREKKLSSTQIPVEAVVSSCSECRERLIEKGAEKLANMLIERVTIERAYAVQYRPAPERKHEDQELLEDVVAGVEVKE